MNTAEDLWANLKAALKNDVDGENRKREKEKKSCITYEEPKDDPNRCEVVALDRTGLHVWVTCEFNNPEIKIRCGPEVLVRYRIAFDGNKKPILVLAANGEEVSIDDAVDDILVAVVAEGDMTE